MRKFDSRTVWTLTLIRNGKQEGDEDIRSAQFRFGRWTDEVTQSKPKRLPSGLRSMIEDSGLTDQAMESGIVISMVIATPSDLTGWGVPFHCECRTTCREMVRHQNKGPLLIKKRCE